MSSSSSCSSIDGGKGTGDSVGMEGANSGGIAAAAVLFSIVVVVMLLSIVGDSCCCCTSSEVDVTLAVLFVDVVVATPITSTL